MGTKLAQLKLYLYRANADIVLLQETWLDNSRKTPHFNGFATYRRDRQNRKGGGLITLVRDNVDNIHHALAAVDVAPTDCSTEILRILIRFQGQSFYVSNIYSPPYISRTPEGKANGFKAEYTLGTCINAGPNNLLAGDFNAHSNYWDDRLQNEVLERADEEGEDIEEWMDTTGAELGNDGTNTFRVDAVGGATSALDLSFAMGGIRIVHWKAEEFIFSDHKPITFYVEWRDPDALTARKRTLKRITKFSYRNADWKKFNKVFNHTYQNYKDDVRYVRRKRKRTKRSWTTTSKPRTDELELENRRITEAFRTASRTIPRGCREDPVPWWDKTLDMLIYDRNKLRTEISNPGVRGTHEEKRAKWAARNEQVKETIIRLRRECWEKFCTTKANYQTSPKSTAALINHLTRDTRPKRCGIITDSTNREYAKDKQKAKGFKNMFAKICSKSKKNKIRGQTMADRRALKQDRSKEERALNNEYMKQACEVPIITRVEYRAAISQLKMSKASGKDDISNEMIVHLDRTNSDRLRNLVSKSISERRVPASWKFGVLFPLPKEGKDPGKLESYRPISLLSCVGKLADRIVTNRLVYFLESQNVLNNSQSGFRKHRSTEDVGMQMIGDIHKTRAISWEQKRNGGGASDQIAVPIDFEKAFDKMNQAKFIKVCRQHRIPTYLAAWYWSYIRQRSYCVRVGTTYSKSCKFDLGVPQGSVCGPILYTLYTSTLSNELDKHKDVGVHHGEFADDLSIWMEFKNIQTYTEEERIERLQPLQAALDTVDKWSQEWGIPLSKTKSGEAILFWSCRDRQNTDAIDLYLGGKRLQFVKESKLLGITIDDRLTFNTHLGLLRTKAKKRMAAIASTCGKTWGGSTAAIRTAYTAHVRSALTYGSSVWYPLISETKCEQLEQVQYAAARTITGCWKRTNVADLLLEANLTPLSVQYETRIMSAVERARHRPEEETLTQQALSIQPTVKERIQCAQSWQHRSDDIQAKCNVESPRLQLIDGHLAQHTRGITSTRGNVAQDRKRILDSLPEDSRIIIKVREDITSYTNRIDPQHTIDYGSGRIKFYDSLLEPISKNDSTERQHNVASATVARLRQAGANCEMWTDGTLASNRRGLGVAQFYTSLNDADDRSWESRLSSGTCSTPFATEVCGITAGLTEILTRPRVGGRRLVVYTDCRGLVTGLAQGPLIQKELRMAAIWKLLYRILDGYVDRLVIQWIPGHCGLKRNEKADKNAKTHFKLMEQNASDAHEKVPSSYGAIKSYYKEVLTANWKASTSELTHRGAIAGPKFTNIKAKETGLMRVEEVTLSQLRTGFCTLIGIGHAFASTGEMTPQLCRWCRRHEENIPHLFDGECPDPRVTQCRATYAVMHGNPLSQTHLATHPSLALDFVRRLVATLPQRPPH